MGDLTIFIVSFISSLEIINVVHFTKSEGLAPDPKIFWWIAASVADASVVNLDDNETLWTGAFSTIKAIVY